MGFLLTEYPKNLDQKILDIQEVLSKKLKLFIMPSQNNPKSLDELLEQLQEQNKELESITQQLHGGIEEISDEQTKIQFMSSDVRILQNQVDAVNKTLEKTADEIKKGLAILKNGTKMTPEQVAEMATKYGVAVPETINLENQVREILDIAHNKVYRTEEKNRLLTEKLEIFSSGFETLIEKQKILLAEQKSKADDLTKKNGDLAKSNNDLKTEIGKLDKKLKDAKKHADGNYSGVIMLVVGLASLVVSVGVMLKSYGKIFNRTERR